MTDLTSYNGGQYFSLRSNGVKKYYNSLGQRITNPSIISSLLSDSLTVTCAKICAIAPSPPEDCHPNALLALNGECLLALNSEPLLHI